MLICLQLLQYKDCARAQNRAAIAVQLSMLSLHNSIVSILRTYSKRLLRYRVAAVCLLCLITATCAHAQSEEAPSDSTVDLFLTLITDHQLFVQADFSVPPRDTHTFQAALEKAFGARLHDTHSEVTNTGHWTYSGYCSPVAASVGMEAGSGFSLLKLIPWLTLNDVDVYSISLFAPQGSILQAKPVPSIQKEKAETRYYWSGNIHEHRSELNIIQWQVAWTTGYRNLILLSTGGLLLIIFLPVLYCIRRYLKHPQERETLRMGTGNELLLYATLTNRVAALFCVAYLVWFLPPSALVFTGFADAFGDAFIAYVGAWVLAVCLGNAISALAARPILNYLYGVDRNIATVLVNSMAAPLRSFLAVVLGGAIVHYSQLENYGSLCAACVLAYIGNLALTLLAARKQENRYDRITLGPLYKVLCELRLKFTIPSTQGFCLYRSSIALGNAAATVNGQVMVTDQLVNLLNYRELRGIMFHEAAHVKLNHAMKRIAAYLPLAAIIGFGATGYLEPLRYLSNAHMLSICILCSVLILIPGSHTYRMHEYECDQMAAKLSGDPQALASALEKLRIAMHATPHWSWPLSMFLSHPSYQQRIDKLQAMPQTMEMSDEFPTDVTVRKRTIATSDYRQYSVSALRLNTLAGAIPLSVAAVLSYWLTLDVVPALIITGVAVAAAAWLCRILADRLPAQLYPLIPGPAHPTMANEIEMKCGLTADGPHAQYDTGLYLDMGTVRLTNAGLHYFGDGFDFSLPWAAIESVSPAQPVPGEHPMAGTRIAWKSEDGNASGVLCLFPITAPGAKEASKASIAAAARLESAIAGYVATPQDAHSAFQSGPGALPPDPLPAPIRAISKKAVFLRAYVTSYSVGLAAAIITGAFTLGRNGIQMPIALSICGAVFMAVINSWYHIRGNKRIKAGVYTRR